MQHVKYDADAENVENNELNKKILNGGTYTIFEPGLRPQTIIDIDQVIGYTTLPTQNAAELATEFRESCDSGSLVHYLETFSHTIAVM